MKIVFIVPLYPHISGSTYFIHELSRQLARSNHTVTIITSNANTPRHWYDPIFGKRKPLTRQILPNRVSIIYLSTKSLLSAISYLLRITLAPLLPKTLERYLDYISRGPIFKKLTQTIHELNPDIVHTSPLPFYLNYQVAKIIKSYPQKRPRLIITPFFHFELKTYHNPWFQFTLSEANQIHLVTPHESEACEQYYPNNKSKHKYLPLFLKINNYDLKSIQRKSLEIKEKLNLQNKKIILYAGTKAPEKGCILTLQAVENLYRSGFDIVFIAIGNSTLAWENAVHKIQPISLIDLPAQHGLTKSSLFSMCDIYCMPSIADSFGLVYLEAWHMRKPIIAADTPTAHELLANSAMYVTYNDIKNLQETLTQLLQNKPLQERLGKQGYALLNEKYDFQSIIHKYEEFFTI